jgi:hypothetical protein
MKLQNGLKIENVLGGGSITNQGRHFPFLGGRNGGKAAVLAALSLCPIGCQNRKTSRKKEHESRLGPESNG